MAGTSNNVVGEQAVEEVLEPCEVKFNCDGETGRGSSTHFNERGILITCSSPLPLDRKVKLVLKFPGFKNAIEVQGEVVWTNIHGPNDPLAPRGMGVKFLNLERDIERLLVDLAGQYEAYGGIYHCFYT
ncbi:MAG: PilZ domain-containing protein [Syntrophobacteraceae bacterium]